MILKTEEELRKNYQYNRKQLEERQDSLRKGELKFSKLLDQTSNEIRQMLQKSETDSSEARDFSLSQLNKISEEYTNKFSSEKRKIQKKLDENEQEFNRSVRKLKAK